MKIAVIGGGISGISFANLMNSEAEVTVFEKEEGPGGLVRCTRVRDNLYHLVGGHVFNAKDKHVSDWFWSKFDREKEFVQAKRNAKILLDDTYIGYPIEDHLFQMDKSIAEKVVEDILALDPVKADNFGDFLQNNFGPTLFELYFKPYNTKIWQKPLQEIDLDWLEGKLPMPNRKELLLNNIYRQQESSMVHSSFYYAKENGSQFIIDRLSEGIHVKSSLPVRTLSRVNNAWEVHGELFDKVVWTANVQSLAESIQGEIGIDVEVNHLPFNGTSNVFCECDITDISWLYLPEEKFKAHRIIYTGTFSESNNKGTDRMTCVVEFSGNLPLEEMKEEITKLPGNLNYISHNHAPFSYVIQPPGTRDKMKAVKKTLEAEGIYLLGRFAEWEYYNMDKAIDAAMKLKDQLLG